MNKKAYYYTVDAFLALVVIFSVLFLINPLNKHMRVSVETQDDLIRALSELKMSEINNSYAESLRQTMNLSEDISVLEQIAEFYAKGMDESQFLAESILGDIGLNESIGIWFGDSLVASRNTTSYVSARDVWVSRQFVSGIDKPEEGGDSKGFSARAFLRKNSTTNYFYFGGYIGDGNISVILPLAGNIIGAELEIAINGDFAVFINGDFSGSYEQSPSSTTPAIYNLGAYLERFITGDNLIEIRGNGSNLYVAGGFLKVVSQQEYSQRTVYNLPGIEGLVNIYDSFYVPGEINSMEVFLRYNTNNQSLFMNIGNQSVFNRRDEGENSVLITNAELVSILDYPSLNKNTIPFRIGLENVSYVSEARLNADVVSVTDLSGSMDDCGEYDYDSPYCRYQYCTVSIWGVCISWSWIECEFSGTCNANECGASSSTTRNHEIVYSCNRTLLDFAKEANKLFIEGILNYSGNRVGLVGYRGSVVDGDCHVISEDNNSLIGLVNSWTASGWTGICSGIQKAIDYFDELEYSPDRLRVMVVMSDGEANRNCEGGTSNAKQSAIDKACEAFNDYNITVHAVGFGSYADEVTLQAIADCGNGSYYFADVDELVELYEIISQDVISATFVEQTIEAEGYETTYLYPDSYIKIDYEKDEVPYGILVTTEKIFDDNYSVSFEIDENIPVIDAIVISYSGPRWTSKVLVNNSDNDWTEIFSLASYDSNFLNLGDPYAVNVPVEYLSNGTNTIRVFTGLSPSDELSGSQSNKLIYTLLKPGLGYSPILPSSSGCKWEIEFYDGSSFNVSVPFDYDGENTCSYKLGDINYNENNAIHVAVFNLLSSLDLDGDGRLDTIFLKEDLFIDTSEITGIPLVFSIEAEVRVWR